MKYLGMIIGLAVVAFSYSITFGLFPIDDAMLVGSIAVKDPLIAFTSYDPELYIPITLLSYSFGFHHVFNIVLHLVNIVLVYQMILLLVKKKEWALACAAIFALHPLQVESVVWISSRKDLLSTFFVLVSMILYLKSKYYTSVLSFALSLMSKVSTVTMPLILWFDDRKIKNKIPYIVIAVIFGLVALGGKSHLEQDITLAYIPIQSVLLYLEKFFVPINFSLFYAPQWSILGGIALAAILYFRKHTVYGFVFFLIAISPTLPHFSRANEILISVDRYMYFPIIGLALMVAPYIKRNALIGMSLVLCALSLYQTTLWSTPEKVLRKSVAVSPRSFNTYAALSDYLKSQGKIQESFQIINEGIEETDHRNLYVKRGSLYAENGEYERARKEFTIARNIDLNDPDPLFVLANLERQRGNVEKAVEMYKEVLTMDSSYAGALFHIASYEREQGNLEESEELLRQAVKVNPSFKEAHISLSQLLYNKGDIDGAKYHLERVMLIDPDELIRQLYERL